MSTTNQFRQREEHHLAVEGETNQKSTLPVLPRLDRLDRLVQYLEEKQNSTKRHSNSFPPTMDFDKQCKPLSSAIEEVHFKGTLMERVEVLENRVLQLSLEMEEGSASSSSTVPASENNRDNLLVKDQNKAFGPDQNKHSHYQRSSSKTPITRSRKWLRWLQIGC